MISESMNIYQKLIRVLYSTPFKIFQENFLECVDKLKKV